MSCKIGVISIGLLSKALQQEIASMNLESCFIFSELLCHDEMQLPPTIENTDVLLSSGYNATILRSITNMPVITIEPSFYDALCAYKKAIALAPNPIFILPYSESLPPINRISDILPQGMRFAYYDNVSSLDNLIQMYKESGGQCVIGSGLACRKAEDNGLFSVFIYPQDSLRSYIEMAYTTAQTLRQRAEHNYLMANIINHSNSGIVLTDEIGRFVICNKKAQEILGVEPERIAEYSILSFIAAESLHKVMKSHEPVKHLISSFQDEQYIISATPIFVKSDFCNIMFALDSFAAIQSQERQIRKTLSQKGFIAYYRFDDYHSFSPGFNALITKAKTFAKSEENIIIQSETGTGKEIMAQSIHNCSNRANRPFVAVNCSAISENLLESELFGYDEGAFTGAKKGGKPGYFEMAHSGTIFLDEIGELSIEMQSKLLRVLQEKQVIRIGGNKVINFDARVIAATNRNLWEMVSRGKFREDLYYRLNVLELNLPPLRERQEDIVPLFLIFIAKQKTALAERLSKRVDSFKNYLYSYSWPGNIRELENFSKMLAATTTEDDLQNFVEVLAEETQKKRRKINSKPDNNTGVVYMEPLADCGEYQKICDMMSHCGGNATKAAALLGISRVTLWRKLKKYHALRNPMELS